VSLTSNAATYAAYARYLEDSLLISSVDLSIESEAHHVPDAVGHAVHILQVFILCVQLYSVVRYFLALRREGWEPKGRGYDLSLGSAYTYMFALPPVDSGLRVPLSSNVSDASAVADI
jgi:hypothetical protein